MKYSFRTNNDGFRGSDWDLSKNRKNIVLLGDSFAFGWGVEENEMFSTLLEEKLQHIDPAIQIVNLAQSGYSLDQVINAFELFGRKFDPVLIIYLYCYKDTTPCPPSENGKFNIESFRSNVTQADWLDEARRNNANVWRFERFWKGLYLYAFYKNYFCPVFFTETNSPQRAWKERYVFTYKNLFPPAPPYHSNPTRYYTAIQQLYSWYGLTKLYEDSSRKPLILMDVSNKMLLHQKDRKDSDRWILRHFAHQYENVFFADFESELRSKNDGVARFLDVDVHWNPEGHKLATEMVDDIIMSNWSILQIDK